MKSSSGEHFLALDHVRALAAFMVFNWHFLHTTNGTPVPFNTVSGPLTLLDEGHTGVALFMTLSGYLFAKLLDGKSINYPAFFFNRAIRLLPLLIVVLSLVTIQFAYDNGDVLWYLRQMVKGIVLPTLPNGGWSLTTEFHFYLILPMLLWLGRRSRWLMLAAVFSAIFLRLAIWQIRGEVINASYWTIIGRFDQFALGMLMYAWRSTFTGRHVRLLISAALFISFYTYFNHQGGWHRFGDASLLWVFLPTIEGLFYAIFIAWYDSSFSPPNKGISRALGVVGGYSYAIYLFHFFVVFRAAHFMDEQVLPITNFYVALPFSILCFAAMVPIGYLSFRFIESPFLKFRRRYTRPVNSR